ncbi:hypothetical protein [Oleiagrimonas sp. C23AA]|uniref:hypothetical protein n=1 Tax=Oleiagrimonas sp. C23AA TaxID=2719047 RepID=UPI001423382E|nr:hypothetical protein [Oleiagrimonas sp. C23AA]NII09487.1 hypothetical protein [Oleiagrimonas sp. C23AA]
MKMTRIATLLSAAALLLGSMNPKADASVIYTWQPVNDKVPNTAPDGACCAFDLWLEVTDEAFKAGSMNYSYYGYPNPGAPIIAFFSSTALMTPPSGNHQPWTWELETDVQFGEYLTGGMYVNDGQVSYYMGGRNQLWTVRDFRADDPSWGCYDEGCSGATGYWVTDSVPPPVPVPEPDLFPALALLAAGLLGVDTARRKRTGTGSLSRAALR